MIKDDSVYKAVSDRVVGTQLIISIKTPASNRAVRIVMRYLKRARKTSVRQSPIRMAMKQASVVFQSPLLLAYKYDKRIGFTI